MSEGARERSISPRRKCVFSNEEAPKGDGEEEDQGEEQEEEAKPVRVSKSPSAPTKEERDSHNVSHLPFRDWCWE